jgi:hypothetical protein
MVGLTMDLCKKSMDQSDIKYVMEILTDAKINNDWENNQIEIKMDGVYHSQFGTT